MGKANTDAAEAEVLSDPPESGFEPSRYSVLDTDADKSKLGTYLGVFRPTLLTIFGVIMYIRMGWVVGNAGLLGALLILFMTFLITGTAALSFSSITTNIRLKAGGGALYLWVLRRLDGDLSYSFRAAGYRRYIRR